MTALLNRLSMQFVLAVALVGPAGACAAALTSEDAEMVRAVVQAQLEAFRDDDADSAFETAAPAVREAIGSSGRFLAMVRGAYPMVYRPARIAFHQPEEAAGQILQMVEITDADAKSWLALFSMEKQPDNSWRISGCLVAENHWRAA